MQNSESGSRGSESAREWASEQAQRVGSEVQRLRRRRNLSAVQLSERTEELGYPITRGTIAKIEGNHRAGKLDVAEVVVLSAALDVPPVLLLYPAAPDGRVEALPSANCTSDKAVQWFSGESSPPQKPREDGAIRIERSSDGAKLLDAIRKRRDFTSGPMRLFDLIDKGGQGEELSGETRTALQEWREEVAKLNAEIRHLGGTVDDG